MDKNTQGRNNSFSLRTLFVGVTAIAFLISILQFSVVFFITAVSLLSATSIAIKSYMKSAGRLSATVNGGAKGGCLGMIAVLCSVIGYDWVSKYLKTLSETERVADSVMLFTPTEAVLFVAVLYIVPAYLIGALVGQVVWSISNVFQHRSIRE